MENGEWIGGSMTSDDELPIKGRWLRQLSRCEVAGANGRRESQSARTLNGGLLWNVILEEATLRCSAGVGMDHAAGLGSANDVAQTDGGFFFRLLPSGGRVTMQYNGDNRRVRLDD